MNKKANIFFSVIYTLLISLSLYKSAISFYGSEPVTLGTVLLIPFLLSIPLMIHLNLKSKAQTKTHNTFLKMTLICFISVPILFLYAKHNPDYSNYGLGNVYLSLLLVLFWFATIFTGTKAMHISEKVV